MGKKKLKSNTFDSGFRLSIHLTSKLAVFWVVHLFILITIDSPPVSFLVFLLLIYWSMISSFDSIVNLYLFFCIDCDFIHLRDCFDNIVWGFLLLPFFNNTVVVIIIDSGVIYLSRIMKSELYVLYIAEYLSISELFSGVISSIP